MNQLSVHPLAELIHEISEARLSGALRLARERFKAVVYFDAGQIVAALTNLRSFRLVEILRRGGTLDATRLGEVVGERMNDEQAAVALVRAGLLSPADLKRLQERQASDVLRELLGWTEGEWEFDPRVRVAGGYRTRVDAPRLLIESARNFPPEFVSSRMGDDGETVTPTEGALERAERGVQLLPAEAFVLSRVSAPSSLGEVVAVSGLPEAETRRAVYALTLGGLLARGRWPRALPDDVLRAAARLAQADAQRGEQESAQKVQPEARPAEPVEEADRRGTVEELLALARGTTHYEVLGVARSASPDDIKRAYYSLARRLHPDRFRRDADAAAQQKIDAAFARIAQAYDTLKDSSARAAYDLKLSKQRSAPRREESAPRAESKGAQSAASNAAAPGPFGDSAQAGDAEQKFQQGFAALRRGDGGVARELLAEAVRLAPRQARYRAYFGRALSLDKSGRRQAEAELQAAIALDPSNVSYHVMLAELYRDVGLRRKAEDVVARALSLDPRHADSLRLLEELRRAT
jgi:DnaJ-domain-containing protein 1